MDIIIHCLFALITFLIITSIIGITLIAKRNFKYKLPLILTVGEYSVDNLTKATFSNKTHHKIIVLTIINTLFLIFTFSFVIYSYVSTKLSIDISRPVWPVPLIAIAYCLISPLTHLRISKLLK